MGVSTHELLTSATTPRPAAWVLNFQDCGELSTCGRSRHFLSILPTKVNESEAAREPLTAGVRTPCLSLQM